MSRFLSRVTTMGFKTTCGCSLTRTCLCSAESQAIIVCSDLNSKCGTKIANRILRLQVTWRRPESATGRMFDFFTDDIFVTRSKHSFGMFML